MLSRRSPAVAGPLR